MGQIIKAHLTRFPYTRFPPFSKEKWGSGRSGARFPIEPKQHETGEAGSGKSPCLLAFTGATYETDKQAHEELTRLVRLCGMHYYFTESEHANALAIALADPVNALICFRGMAARLSLAI